MIPVLVPVLVLVLGSVWAQGLEPPVDVSVNATSGLLTWTPAADEDSSGLRFSVQFRRFNSETWQSVSSCARTPDRSCRVGDLLREADLGCVRLRVRGELGESRSEAAEACGADTRCTPQVRLSSVPGSLTVHLSRDHALLHDVADHAKHRVCLSRSDRPRQQRCRVSLSSLNLSGSDLDPDLDRDRTYCVTVQFVHFSSPEGAPSCPVCLQVLRVRPKHLGLVLGLVLPALGLVLGVVLAYVLIFHREKLKQWLKPPQGPECLVLPAGGALVCEPSEEECSVIQAFTQLHHRDYDYREFSDIENSSGSSSL